MGEVRGTLHGAEDELDEPCDLGANENFPPMGCVCSWARGTIGVTSLPTLGRQQLVKLLSVAAGSGKDDVSGNVD